ncbi:Uncharacterised protein [Vibrio cholerae]|nr:Uncharacterised protein [Vibrio cholerae]
MPFFVNKLPLHCLNFLICFFYIAITRNLKVKSGIFTLKFCNNCIAIYLLNIVTIIESRNITKHNLVRAIFKHNRFITK